MEVKDMTNVIHALLSSVCITIPEFIFMAIITLKLLKRNDMLDFYDLKNNLLSILTITIPPAILYDTLNYIIKTQSLINRIIAFILLYILLIYILKQRELCSYSKLKQKALIYLIISLLIVFAIEAVSFPIILKLLNKTYQTILLDFNLVLLCSLSSRIIEIIVLIVILVRKNRKYQINILEYIFKNKFFMKALISLVTGLIIIEGYFIKLIVLNDILTILGTIYEQLIIVIAFTFLIPGLLFLMLYSFINYSIMIINSEKQNVRND